MCLTIPHVMVRLRQRVDWVSGCRVGLIIHRVQWLRGLQMESHLDWSTDWEGKYALWKRRCLIRLSLKLWTHVPQVGMGSGAFFTVVG
jgi:hypothetical protein